MSKIFMLIRSAVFLTWLSLALATLALLSTIWAVQAGFTAARVTGQLATAAAKHSKTLATATASHRKQVATMTAAHRKQLAQTVMKTKAKARLRRFVVAIPLVGLAAVAAFEELDFREWLKDHPTGTRADYGCVTYTASVEVLGEFSAEIEPVLARVPAVVRPSTDTIVGWLPECDAAE